MPHTLHSGQRLKSRKQIGALFAEGRSFHLSPLRVIYRIPDQVVPGDQLQFGVTVPARHFKKAVDRNRIKRLVRETWRMQRQPLEGHTLHVFFIYTGLEMPTYPLISEKMAAAIQRLFLNLVNEKNTPHT